MKNEELKIKPGHIIEIMKNEWTDIHHTRNQEWTSMAIIGGIIFLLFQVKGNSEIQKAILIFGLIACILSLLMLVKHWLLFRSKLRIIELLENELGIQYKFHTYQLKIPVQCIIFLFYFLLTSALAGWLTWLSCKSDKHAIIVSISVFALGIGISFLIHLWIKNKVKDEVKVAVKIEKTGEFKILDECEEIFKKSN